MPGECGADGDLGGLGIADFADHDDIGILAEDGAEAGGEGEAAAGFDGDLGDAVELVLNGVFDGDDLLLGGIDALKDRVEGGGLSRAGGAGGEEEAVGFSDEGFEEARAGCVETEFLRFEQTIVPGEETEHDAFAVDGGHGADADVDTFAAVMDLDMAILGKEPFGDVHVGHDLDAGDQGGMKVPGRGRLGLEDAIDAVAEFDGGFEGEEMDVAGAFAEGGGDDDVDEVDDGGLVGGDLDVVEVFSFGTGGLGGVEILDHPFHRDLVGIGEALGDFGGRTDFNRDFQAGEQTEIVDEFGGGRADGGDVKDAAAGVEGEQVVFAGEIDGDQTGGRIRGGTVDGLRRGINVGTGGVGLHSGRGTEAGVRSVDRIGVVVGQDLECGGDDGLGHRSEDFVLRDFRM